MTVLLKNCPTDLQALPQWVCWHEKYPHENPERGCKVPLNPNTRTPQGTLPRARSNDPSTWGTFRAAQLAAALPHPDTGVSLATGIGFEFTEDDDFIGVDLDHCIYKGSITPWARRVVELLDTYTEISPSGTGLHLLLKGGTRTPIKTSKWNNGEDKDGPDYRSFEVYPRKQFLRMTGDLVYGTPPQIQDRARRLDILLTRNKDKLPLLAQVAGGFDANRNDAFTAIAGLLRTAKGLELPDMELTLLLINSTCNVPPAPEQEIVDIARSVCNNYDKGTAVQIKARGTGLPITSPRGNPVACCLNAEYLLPKVPGFTDLWFNDFDQSVYVGKEKLTDEALIVARRQLENMTLIPWLNLNTVRDGLAGVAQRTHRHPVRDYLRSVTWDQVPRLNTWLCRYVREDDDTVTGAFGRLFLISAVARIMRPGCEVRQVLLLTGQQNIGKSRLGAILAGSQWFSAGLSMALSDKDAMQALWGNWIVEMPELSSMTKSTIEAAKAFISRGTDKFRAPYARFMSTHERQCVIIATSNDVRPLKDRTGNTRFLPVHCSTSCDQDWLIQNRDQLWAEAFHAFNQGEQWWSVSTGVWAEVERRRDESTEEDLWEETVRDAFLHYEPPHVNMHTVLAVWLNILLDKQDPRAQNRVGALVAALIRRKEIPYKKGQIGPKYCRSSVWIRNVEAGPGKPLPVDGNNVI